MSKICIFGTKPLTIHKLKGPEKISDLNDISFGIIGWRKWTHFSPVSGQVAGSLQGTFGGIWTPGKVMRDTTYHPNVKANATNDVGIYARKRETDIGVTHGEVLLWGTVYEYEDGYRATRAFPLSLFCREVMVAEKLLPWAKYGVYINVYSPDTPGADELGYIKYA